MLGYMALSEDIAMLIVEIEANVSHMESLTHGLSDGQFNWKPEPGRWSIAECITHLNIANGGDLGPLEEAINKGRAGNRMGEGPFTYGFVSKKFVATMEPGGKRKIKAPRLYVPPSQGGKDETIKEYRRIAGELRRLTRSADGLHLARIKTSMPALPSPLRPFVKMPLGARLHLITAHDRRHLTQAERVRDHPDFPKS